MKASPVQHTAIPNDNNFVGSLPSYISSPTQPLTQVHPSKTADMQYSHYVMPGPPGEYNSPNLPLWDPLQMTPAVPNNNKKVIDRQLYVNV